MCTLQINTIYTTTTTATTIRIITGLTNLQTNKKKSTKRKLREKKKWNSYSGPHMYDHGLEIDTANGIKEWMVRWIAEKGRRWLYATVTTICGKKQSHDFCFVNRITL